MGQLANHLPEPKRSASPNGAPTSPKPLALTEATIIEADAAGRALERFAERNTWPGTPQRWEDQLTDQSRIRARELIPIFQATLAPASREAMAVAIDKLLTFAELMNKGPANRKAMVSLYQGALGELPDDLLVEAVDTAIKEHRYNTIPIPGEIMSKVEDQLTHRRRRLALARSAAVSPG